MFQVAALTAAHLERVQYSTIETIHVTTFLSSLFPSSLLPKALSVSLTPSAGLPVSIAEGGGKKIRGQTCLHPRPYVRPDRRKETS